MESSAQHARFVQEQIIQRAFDDLSNGGHLVTRRAVDQRIRKAGLILARPAVRKIFERLRQGSALPVWPY